MIVRNAQFVATAINAVEKVCRKVHAFLMGATTKMKILRSDVRRRGYHSQFIGADIQKPALIRIRRILELWLAA
jgi:hypothetical protein